MKISYIAFFAVLMLCLIGCTHSSSSGGAASGGGSSGDASVYDGVWLFYFEEDGDSELGLYAILDDGAVTAASNFMNDGGSITVNDDGDYTIILAVTGVDGSEDLEFTGNFYSDSEGEFSFDYGDGIATGTLEKLSDRGAAAGEYFHILEYTAEGSEFTQEVALEYTVESNGALSNVSEMPSPSPGDKIESMVGYAFLDDNSNFIMYGVTNLDSSNPWNQINLRGYVEGGSLEIDAGGDYEGTYYDLSESLLAPVTTN